MRLHDVISSVYTKPWTRINNFSVQLSFANIMFEKLVGWDLSEEDLILSLKSIDTPQYSNNAIEVFTGNEWRFNNGRDEMFRFTMTFRDFDQMKVYTSFVNIYNKSKDNYFDNIKLSIIVNLDDEDGVSKRVLFEAKDAIVDSISKVNFDHTTENQIVEFSVEFKCSSPLHKSTGSLEGGIGGVVGSVVDGVLNRLKF